MKKEINLDNNDTHLIKTAITKIEQNNIITRGYSQEELIANISFSEMVYLLLKGNLPSSKEARMFNHILVSFCDHGVTPPSTQTSRLIISSGSPLNVALAGGILSFGKKHAGAIEESMKLLQNTIDENIKSITNSNSNSNNNSNNNNSNNNSDKESFESVDDLFDDKDIERIANDIVNDYLNNNEMIPGFGHRFHSEDPRGRKIIELAKKEGCIGIHSKLVLAIEKILFNKKGIHINLDGANGGVLSDMGFSSFLGFGIFMIGRIPGIIAHITEEITDEEEFRKFCQIEDVLYCGSENNHLNKVNND